VLKKQKLNEHSMISIQTPKELNRKWNGRNVGGKISQTVIARQPREPNSIAVFGHLVGDGQKLIEEWPLRGTPMAVARPARNNNVPLLANRPQGLKSKG